MSNLEKIEYLLSDFEKRRPILSQQNYVVFGSAAIVLNGVDLSRTINDLDFFVSPEFYERLKTYFPEKETKQGVFALQVAQDIEILCHFPGVEFQAVFSRASPLEGHPHVFLGSLKDIVLWKTEQKGLRSTDEGRKKDENDLSAINSASKSN